ncbi:sporulation integral membrane protein YtvI [Paenibacillus apiarius]|uniref:Sporulation integral membrane protein YtvI n=1 Tax=Paenibacillus apiarius TaxID=46240 RepID=A0ABT4DWT0_9BACL|nr:sporulation integral membrane protein YtvI [Paenibacillus apiarius]MCY9515333.1 sporulation integral membrane protein YtvI [Paenibacillus apiarius]MCY9521789.1 sporulation integral membrane protein YtvI [Paenibacillus apiarius]MCY9550182.1 sporulation integral membrane protein YtvI [Paenibacillus apiarius]MCY9559458.1 sporulation integral membrane protein YtvI [Paenibacillus apiarius]MCY9686924.1 sporulation integral membrane protein YtvI [Paenibacillus apiarius]
MDQLIIKRIWRGGWVLLATAAVLFASWMLVPLIYPFLIAWAIALALNPVVQWMSLQLKFPRWLSVTVSLMIFILAMLTVAAAVITRIVKEIYNLSMTLEYFLNVWRDLFLQLVENENVQKFIHSISSLYKDNPNIQGSINNNLSSTAQTITAAITNLITLFLDGIVRLLSSLPNVATISMVILLAAFFIGKDWTRWTLTFTRIVPERVRRPTRNVWQDLKHALFGYLRAQFLLISITAVVVIIGLLVLHVEYAVTIGLLIGLVDFLPYLGVGAVMVPWIIYSFAAGSSSLGIGLAVLYSIVLVARQIMEPKVLASSVGLDPLITLVAMFAGLKLFGVMGLIIGPVTLVLISAMNRAYVFRDLRNYILTGRR